jgi:chromosome segregation ATPase
MGENEVIKLVLEALTEFKKDFRSDIKSQLRLINDSVKDLKKDFSDKFELFEQKVSKIYSELHKNDQEVSKLREKINIHEGDIKRFAKDIVEYWMRMNNESKKIMQQEVNIKILEKDIDKKILKTQDDFRTKHQHLLDTLKDKSVKRAKMGIKVNLIYGVIGLIGATLFYFIIDIIKAKLLSP